MSKDRIPWFKCYPSKLLGVMGGMGPDENLIYLVILLRIYEVGGPIKDDARTISRRCGLPQKRVIRALDDLEEGGKITVENGLIDSETTHPYLEEFEIFQNNMKKAGKASAAKRNEKRQTNQQSDATIVQQGANKPSTTKTRDLRLVKEEPKGSSKKENSRRSRIAKDAKPNEVQTEYARKFGVPKSEWGKFVDWHVWKGTLGVDWDAAWRTWVRKWADMNGRKPVEAQQQFEATDDPILRFPGDVRVPESRVKRHIAKFLENRHSWPENLLGSPPGFPTCKVPDDLLPEQYRRQKCATSGEGR